MERTERDIIDFMKKYKDEKDAIKAQGEMLAFMGIPEGAIFLDNAKAELEAEQQQDDTLKQEYFDYIRQGSKFYCSYEVYKQMKEAGRL